MPGEYRIDYVCTFIKEADSYIAKEESYNEVITNFTLFNYSKITSNLDYMVKTYEKQKKRTCIKLKMVNWLKFKKRYS